MLKEIRPAIVLVVALTIITGLVYPLVVTGLAQVIFPDEANGQLVVRDGRVVGSQIIGQPFSSPGYFHPRLSAAGNGYDATASSGSNLGPTNADHLKAVQERVEALRKAHPEQNGPIPVDLVTASASGLDPHISPAAAEYQLVRVARVRGLPQDKVRTLVTNNTEGRTLGLLG